MEGDQYEDGTVEAGAGFKRFLVGVCLIVALGAIMAAWGFA